MISSRSVVMRGPSDKLPHNLIIIKSIQNTAAISQSTKPLTATDSLQSKPILCSTEDVPAAEKSQDSQANISSDVRIITRQRLNTITKNIESRCQNFDKLISRYIRHKNTEFIKSYSKILESPNPLEAKKNTIAHFKSMNRLSTLQSLKSHSTEELSDLRSFMESLPYLTIRPHIYRIIFSMNKSATSNSDQNVPSNGSLTESDMTCITPSDTQKEAPFESISIDLCNDIPEDPNPNIISADLESVLNSSTIAYRIIKNYLIHLWIDNQALQSAAIHLLS